MGQFVPWKKEKLWEGVRAVQIPSLGQMHPQLGFRMLTLGAL